MPVFTAAEIRQFMELGYVVGRRMIPGDTVTEYGRLAMAAVETNRLGTGWKDSLVLLPDFLGLPARERIAARQVMQALDELVGPERWSLPDSFGSWPLLFPGFARPPWRAIDAAWHVEGRTRMQTRTQPAFAITMILLFSDIGEGDGGTAVATGSHKVVAQVLSRRGDGMAQLEATGAYLSECPQPPVIEAQGRAGDILFMHPFTVHATSLNIGQRVRIACNYRAELRGPLRLSADGDGALSAVEQALVA